MTKRLFVGGLAWGTDEFALRAAFERFGEVKDAAVITDAQSGRSRGFGFVTFNETADAERALEEMDGTELDGRRIAVNVAQERQRGGGGGPPRGGAERGGRPRDETGGAPPPREVGADAGRGARRGKRGARRDDNSDDF